MRKIFPLFVIAAVAIALCAAGCRKKEAKPVAAKAAPVVAKKADIAVFADQICKAVTTDGTAVSELLALDFIGRVRVSTPSDISDENRKKRYQKFKEDFAKGWNKPESCQVLKTKDTDCDTAYMLLDSAFGSLDTPDMAETAGKAQNITSCGLVSLDVKGQKPLSVVAGKVGTAYKILFVKAFRVKGQKDADKAKGADAKKPAAKID